jgi:hypothetical protein
MPEGTLVTVQLTTSRARALIDAVDLTKERSDSDLTQAVIHLMAALHQIEDVWDSYEKASK